MAAWRRDGRGSEKLVWQDGNRGYREGLCVCVCARVRGVYVCFGVIVCVCMCDCAYCRPFLAKPPHLDFSGRNDLVVEG